VPSRPPGRGQQRPALPVGAGLLEGYISVLEHKVSLRPAAPSSRGGTPPPIRSTLVLPCVPRDGCPGWLHRRGAWP